MNENELSNVTLKQEDAENQAAASVMPQLEPPKKKKSRAALFLGILLAVCVLACLTVTVKAAFASPKSKVIKAVTAAASGANSSLRSYLGSFDAAEDTYEQSLDLTIEGLSMPLFLADSQAALFEGFGFRYTTLADTKTADFNLDAGITYLGIEYLSMSVSGVDSVYYLALPQFLDGWFSFDTGLEAGNTANAQKEFQQKLITFLEKDSKEIWDSITVTDLKKKEAVSLNGKEIDCRFYEVVVPNETLWSVTDELFTMFYPLFFGQLSEIEKQLGSLEGIEDGLEFSAEEFDEETLRSELKEGIASLGDVTCLLYLDKNGNLVYFETTLTSDGESVFLSTSYTGKEAPADEITVQVTAADTDISFTMATSFEEKTGAYTLSMNFLTSGQEVLSLTSDITYHNVKKGEQFFATLNDLTVSVPELLSISLSGEMSTQKTTKSVSAPEGQIRDFTVFEDEEALEEEIMEHMENDSSFYQFLMILMPIIAQFM